MPTSWCSGDLLKIIKLWSLQVANEGREIFVVFSSLITNLINAKLFKRELIFSTDNDYRIRTAKMRERNLQHGDEKLHLINRIIENERMIVIL